MFKRILLLPAAAATLGACATTPDVTYNYYLPTSETAVTLAQTVGCTADKKSLVITYAAPTINTVYSADPTKQHALPLKKLDGSLSDIDFSFNVTDDGRLKAVNASWTGQGETILKSAINLGTALVLLGGSGMKAASLQQCDTIDQWGGGKTVTLTYIAKANLASGDHADFAAAGDRTSAKIYGELKNELPPLAVAYTQTDMPIVAAYKGPEPDDMHKIYLPRMKKASISITADGKPIYSSTVMVPGNTDYYLPIPTPQPFGSEKFALTLSDTGAINTIDYGKSTGAAGPMNVAGAIATTVAPAQ